MRTDIAYVNGLGERVELGGGEASLHYFEHELRDWEWAYGTGPGGRVSSFSRNPSKPQKKKFPVGISAASADEGIELRNRIDEIGERDVASMTPGKLYVGDWYIRCWIIACEPTDYWMDDRFAELGLTVLVDEPGWVRETTTSLVPQTGGSQTGGGVDFPFDFPFEFKRDGSSHVVYNDALSGQDFLWRVYGPAENPAISIGGNTYKVNVDVPTGYQLVVDSMARTVRLVAPDGTWTEEYGSREPGAKGSGSYIFEQIKPSSNTLSWDNSFAFDLTVYEVRTSCPWEEG